MKLESLRDLYVEQLQDLYNAEQQLIKALPKMARAASSEELKAAFEDHLGQTRQHAQRIETIFEQMGDGIKDAALIAAAQRVEHYEIAGYGCVRAYATRLGEDDAATLLSQTLQEEKAADEMLNGIAEQLNIEVPQESRQTEKRTVKSSRGRTRRAA